MQPPFTLGPSSDPVGVVTLGLGALLLVLAIARPASLRAFMTRGSSAQLLAVFALTAALLSWGYLHYFLRGGPRIIDATSYFLEGRALSEGQLAFPITAPTAAFRGRFSLLGPGGLAVIFPPGYPLLLALGFRLGAPLLVGPLLAALLVVATYVLARELDFGEPVARVAALLSVLCAALRYHTADTMSHGLSALLLATTVAAAARPTRLRSAAAGLCAGWLLATRPMSGAVAVLLAVLVVAGRSAPRERRTLVLLTLVSLAPGLGLLAAHQHAATGSFLHSTQLAYYALADGPPGCFGWGFGKNVGCRFEHGDFVKRRLTDGFGPLEALWVTGERLYWHLFDVANLAFAALLIPWVVWTRRARRGVGWLGLGVALTVVAYLPFYFPGSYPGGGARFLADALPLEHVLLALGLVELGLVAFAPAALLLGFALNGVHAHLALRDREGGHPMFDRALLEARGISRGLVWVSTDHGFALGHDPAVTDPRAGLVVARARGDAHDLALFERLGHPPAYRYDYSPDTGRTSLEPYRPPAGPWRWEAEAEWPPLVVVTGWVHPDFRPCLSRGQGLHFRPAPVAAAWLELGAPSPGWYELKVGWMAERPASLVIAVGTTETATTLTHRGGGCELTSVGRFELTPTSHVRVATHDALILDYLELTRTTSK